MRDAIKAFMSDSRHTETRADSLNGLGSFPCLTYNHTVLFDTANLNATGLTRINFSFLGSTTVEFSIINLCYILLNCGKIIIEFLSGGVCCSVQKVDGGGSKALCLGGLVILKFVR